MPSKKVTLGCGDRTRRSGLTFEGENKTATCSHLGEAQHTQPSCCQLCWNTDDPSVLPQTSDSTLELLSTSALGQLWHTPARKEKELPLVNVILVKELGMVYEFEGFVQNKLPYNIHLGGACLH